MRTDSRCTRTSLRRGIGTRPEDRPLPRGVHAVRTVGSAQLVVGFVRGERRRRGVARRSSRRGRPIGENSDYQTSTPSLRLIRARRILTKRRHADAVLRTPRRARRWRRVRFHARGHALAWLWRQRHRRRRRRGLGEETLLRGPCVARAAPGSWVRRRAAVAASRRRAWHSSQCQ